MIWQSFSYLNFFHEWQMIIVSSHSLHKPVLQVQNNFLLVSVVLDETVQCIWMRYPTNQARIRRQRNNSKPLNGQITSQCLKIKYICLGEVNCECTSGKLVFFLSKFVEFYGFWDHTYFGIINEQWVDETKELHDSFILT